MWTSSLESFSIEKGIFPMNEPNYICIKCGVSISREEIDSGKGGVVNDNAYCSEHYQELVKKAALDTQIIGEEDSEEESAEQEHVE
jgi:hypothetical protein